MERTTLRPVERMRNRPADGRKLQPRHRVDARNGLQQSLRIRVLRVVKDVVDLALLDHPAEIHDHHVVGHLRHHAEVVGDEHDRHSPLPLQLAQQIQDLRLRGDVQRRRRLVGDQQARIAGKRDRDHRPLAQPAAQFEGIFVDAAFGFRDAYAAQRFDSPASCLLLAHRIVQKYRLGKLRADRMHGRERGHGLLKDQADVSASNRTHLTAVGLELDQVGLRSVGASQHDLAVDDATGTVDDAQDRLRRDAFAAAALADDAQRFARRRRRTKRRRRPWSFPRPGKSWSANSGPKAAASYRSA